MFEFTWTVREEGYEWLEGNAYSSFPFEPEEEPVHGWYLLPKAGYEGRRYYPLRDAKYSGLFRTFANTAPTREGILSFVQDHGVLGASRAEFAQPTDTPGTVNLLGAESFEFWKQALKDLRYALDLWDLISAKDPESRKRLSSFIEWQDTAVYYWDAAQPRKAVIADDSQRPVLLRYFTPGDVVQPAIQYVHDIINTQRKGHVSPRLLWDLERMRSVDCVCPHNLFGALWQQLAQSIHKGKGPLDYHRCAECSTWFEVSYQAARVDKRFCSNACRSKAYRDRQLQAQQLQMAGVAGSEIAAQLHTTPEIVQGWLAKTPTRAVPRGRGRPRKPLTGSTQS